MKICYFGIYNSEYSRNKILISGLRKNGIEVIECVSRKTGIAKYIDLIKKHWKIKGKYNAMVVGYPGFQSVILAKLLTRKPIIFDAFVSMYDSLVLDRKEVRKGGLRALYYWFLDKVSFSLANVVLFDTNQHCEFVAKEFGVNSRKIKRIFVGADTDMFFPHGENISDTTFKVVFYGHYIPLQGIEYIIRAAKLLEEEQDIVFEIVGWGKGREEMMHLADSLELQNIVFIDEVPISELSRIISMADVCLGIFGNTEKAKRVIPNKVFEPVAMKKPVITSDTPAMRELFSDEEIFFTEVANPSSIADAIISVKSDYPEATTRASQAYGVFEKTASIKILGSELKTIIKESLCA